MQYNNTGYILAGMIIARETGGSLSQALRMRLFEPLGLNDTWVGTDESYPAERAARAYFHKEDEDGQWDIAGAGEPVDGCWDSTDWFPLSGANAAGDIVATPRDLMRWIDGPLRRQGVGRCPPSRNGRQSEGGELPRCADHGKRARHSGVYDRRSGKSRATSVSFRATPPAQGTRKRRA